MAPRTLLPGQRAELWTMVVATGERRLRWQSSELLIEAPNWTRDDQLIVNGQIINGQGHLFRLSSAGTDEPRPIATPGLSELNNDHVLDPDGEHIFVSDSGTQQIHRVSLSGSTAPVQVTSADDGLWHFLHGVSPDGSQLAWVGLSVIDDRVVTNLYLSPATGADSASARQLTDDHFPDDGPEFSPDGQWLWFNSERGSKRAGHAQLFRQSLTFGAPEQMTLDERVNWFPHCSPDGRSVAYVSYPPGTIGHPENIDGVELRLLALDDAGVPIAQRTLATVLGGQGTLNVNSWSPDSSQLAWVAYPHS